jgi:hypothetical protein
LEGESGI